MSYDHKDHSAGSRSTFARLAFNIYGNSSISPNRTPNTFNKSPSPQAFSSSHQLRSPSFRSNHTQEELQFNNEWKYRSSYEIVGITKINNSPHIVISGKNSLQLIRFGTNIDDQYMVEDLLTNNYYLKNKKKIGSILDVKSGYGNYNKLVAASTTTGSIYIFNSAETTEKNRLSLKLSDNTRAVNSLSFNQIDPFLVLSGSQDGSMKLWDLRSQAVKPQSTMFGNSDSVRCLQFSPHNSKKFCSVFDSGNLQKWDLRNPNQFEKKFNAHTGPGLTLDWSPDFDYVATGGRDKQLQIWNMSNTDTKQYPEYVIYAPAPVAEVSFRPNSPTNISASDIALSYLNNESLVQVYNIKRKFIPIYNIENHESSITGLVWENDRYLLSSSRDKQVIRNDVSNYSKIIDNLSCTSVTWSATNDFIFVDQSKTPDDDDATVPTESTFLHPSPSNLTMSTSPTNNVSNESVSSNSLRPQLSRNSSTFRPSMTRGHSHQSHINNSNHYLIPANLPIMKSEKVLTALSENYEIDPTKGILDICDLNSGIARDSGLLRDSQTWKVIKESLIWESKKDLIYNPVPEERQPEITFDDDDSEKYHYSTSNSTNYGKSPSLSDFSEFNNNSFPKRFEGFSKLLVNPEPIKEENSTIKEDSATVAPETIKWDDVNTDDLIKKNPELLDRMSAENYNVMPGADSQKSLIHSEPIPLSKRKGRESFISLLPSTLQAQLLSNGSPTYSISSSLSNASSRPKSSIFQPEILRSQKSQMSTLTKQLTKASLDDDNQKSKDLLPPYQPKELIKHCIDFYIGQGDLIMSSTLLLLFNPKFQMYSQTDQNEILYNYLTFLQRLKAWKIFIKILHHSKLKENFQSYSNNVKIFCTKCETLITNENTKTLYLNDPEIQYGSWFCDHCSNTVRCIYCNEPVKGLNLSRLKCGHIGHFGCMKSWIVDEGMNECPGGCL
ncbi:hypothetical protein WICMUC_001388 [Wickerhamomyces mucosus]|uniref:Restriction of telomere capping protein 1 n=1 Tax=Wickerhamomyces mucosus TaxID=1378264 RepID=A0A9P8PU61_9ASCO|nr:hypothetical protein WICMUC_001388 [Wickerhamomyces mucosus]